MLSLHDIMYEKFLGVNTEITELQIKRGSHIARMNVVNDFFSAVNLLGVLFAGVLFIASKAFAYHFIFRGICGYGIGHGIFGCAGRSYIYVW